MDYYSDNDPHACEWLRGLIEAGLIPEGVVDERDIREVTAADLEGFTACHFFAGIGGWPHALALAGWDATRPVWSASLPCQPFSSAGKRKGVADDRHLWPVFLRLVRECRPATLLGEQVDSADGREWLARVQADLEESGYAVGRASLCAAGVGAPHIRSRLFWVAHAGGERCAVHAGTNGLTRHEPGASSGSGGPPRRLDDPAGQRAGQQGASQPGGDGADDGVPGAAGAGGADGVEHPDGERRPATQGRAAGAGPQPDGAGATGGVGDAGGERVRIDGHGTDGKEAPGVQGADGERQRLRANAGATGTSEPGGVGDAGCQQRKWGTNGAEPGRRTTNDPGSSSEDGFWSASDLIPCRDGKVRRVECGLQPLVDGLPFRLADGRTREVSRAKVLRGIGNAIVPAAAALFVRAFLEAEGDLT